MTVKLNRAEVKRMIEEGKTQKVIADLQGVHVSTIEKCVKMMKRDA